MFIKIFNTLILSRFCYQSARKIHFPATIYGALVLHLDKIEETIMQWEFCELTTSYLDIFTPHGNTRHDLQEFTGASNRLSSAIVWLLAQGWEPVTVTDNYTLYFKRPHQHG
jgi:hypothetical protein